MTPGCGLLAYGVKASVPTGTDTALVIHNDRLREHTPRRIWVDEDAIYRKGTHMTGPLTTVDAVHTWREIIALLVEAADLGSRQASLTPAVHSVALGASLTASSAIALLPSEVDHELEDVELDPATASLSVGALIRAAEQAARRHPIEQFPPGASGVIVGLCELAAEAAL